MAQIICKDLTLGYEGGVVFEHLDLSINKGDYLCIVGNNGSGKTTLTKALLSLKAPLAGSIEFGDGVTKQDIGYLPQQTELQKDFPASVEEVVLSGCTSRLGKRFFMSRNERLEAMQNMKMMNVYDLANKSYRTLSGGQMQRVLLARALCAAGKILILDEPTAALDPLAEQEVFNQFSALAKGKIAVFVSHKLSSAVSASKIVVIDGGTVAEVGNHEELMALGGRYYELFSTQAKRYTGNDTFGA